MKKQLLIFLVIFILIFNVIACTDNDGIAVSNIGDTEPSQAEGSPFVLEQNYPNPFNHSTAIPFRAGSMHLCLKVYDENWQEVQTLIDGKIGGGYITEKFSANNLPSGNYYYVLEGGGHTQVRVMKLLK